MTGKGFWRGILIVVLSVGLALPARADNPETVLIVVAATTVAAAVVVVVTIASLHHKRKKIVITGCVIAGEKMMTVTDEEDRKSYTLSGDMTSIKPGDRMRLLGKKTKPKGRNRTIVWETKEVIKDFGVCQP